MAQKKVPDNNGLESFNKAMDKAVIEFPVTFNLKVVFEASVPDISNMENLSGLFEKLKISNSYIGNKKSSKGKYVSYNYKVILQNKPQLENLYSDLKDVPGLKFAL